MFDVGTFIEMATFVKHRCTNFGFDKKDMPNESVVTGYRYVNERLVYTFLQDFTVEGGSLREIHAKKIVKVLENAVKVGLNDSDGARIQEAVDSLFAYGELFFKSYIYSSVIPQITAIMDLCDGIVADIHVNSGSSVNIGDILVVIS